MTKKKKINSVFLLISERSEGWDDDGTQIHDCHATRESAEESLKWFQEHRPSRAYEINEYALIGVGVLK